MADGKTDTMQEHIQDWPELDEGDAGFLTEEEVTAMILLYLFSSALLILNFPFVF
jgi:hypothetical protein